MDIFLYPVNNNSNDVILSDPTLLIVQIAVVSEVWGGGGRAWVGNGAGKTIKHNRLEYHVDDIIDEEVFQVIKAFLIVSRR